MIGSSKIKVEDEVTVEDNLDLTTVCVVQFLPEAVTRKERPRQDVVGEDT